MPRKIFTAGEILTAADVNTNLMDQAVMVFDDSAARGSAIPSPIEGMVTYLSDSDALFSYSGAAWVPAVNTASIVDGNVSSAKLGTGTILQVVQGVMTANFSTASATYVDITGLTVNITPRSTSSKVLVLVKIPSINSSAGGSTSEFILRRDSTNIYNGTAGSARTRELANEIPLIFLDEPSLAVSITYSVQAKRNAGTLTVPGADYRASIVAIEVAG